MVLERETIHVADDGPVPLRSNPSYPLTFSMTYAPDRYTHQPPTNLRDLTGLQADPEVIRREVMGLRNDFGSLDQNSDGLIDGTQVTTRDLAGAIILYHYGHFDAKAAALATRGISYEQWQEAYNIFSDAPILSRSGALTLRGEINSRNRATMEVMGSNLMGAMGWHAGYAATGDQDKANALGAQSLWAITEYGDVYFAQVNGSGPWMGPGTYLGNILTGGPVNSVQTNWGALKNKASWGLCIMQSKVPWSLTGQKPQIQGDNNEEVVLSNWKHLLPSRVFTCRISLGS